MSHRLLPIGHRDLHPVEAALVAIAVGHGQWVRHCGCGLLILGVNEIDLHCHWREHLAAAKAVGT